MDGARPGLCSRAAHGASGGECAASAAAGTGEAVRRPQRPLSSSRHKGTHTHTAAAFHGGIAACRGIGEGEEVFS